jgi:integrase/recombinase XerC
MQGNSATTRARALASLRTFYKWLDRNGILHNPNVKLMATPKVPHKVPRPLEVHQVFDLLDTITSNDDDWIALRDKALLGLLYGMGLRISEGISLTVGDVENTPDMLRITGKGNKMREVPTLPYVFKLINAYKTACPYPVTPSRPLFLGEKGGKLNAGMVQKHMRALRIQLGLGDGATPHAMRHSYATHLLGEGLNLREVQTLLGHESLSTTQRYTEVDYKQLLETFKKAHPRAF